MKHFLLTIIIVFLGITVFAQEVRFPPAVVSAGGSTSGSAANLSRWRLAPIHVITFKGDEKIKSDLKSQSITVQDWDISIYPNPAADYLNLEFTLPEQKEFILKLTDFTGRIMFSQAARPFLNGSTLELNISDYSSGIYLLQIASPDQSIQKIYSIIKL